MKNLLSFFSGLRRAWVLFAVLAVISCDTAKPENADNRKENVTLTMMTWNIHNLFDGNDDGHEYTEFLQSSGWSEEKYKGRVNSISDAIGKIEPDIIMFQEIESLKILEDIALSLHRGYFWSHFASNPGASTGLGVLSRYPLAEAKAHSITVNNDTSPRPVLETRIQTDQGSFIIFICHWKSKIGGDDVTEKTRKSCVRIILRRVRELFKEEPLTGIIIAGDLNENYDEFYRRGSNTVCALLADDPYGAVLINKDEGQKDFLVVTGKRPPLSVHFPEETIAFFSPWAAEIDYGSYFYKNEWETIDHFLLSGQFFDNYEWEYDRAFAAGFEPFADQRGIPVPYNPRTGFGLSDHLPLVMTLKFIAGE